MRKNLLKYNFRDLVIFLIIFNFLAIPLYIALFTNFSYKPLQELNAQMLFWTLKSLGYNVNINSFTVNLMDEEGLQEIEISWDSTGWKSMYALASLVMASHILKLSRRIKFAIFGVLVVFGLNYLRVTTTVLSAVILGFKFFDIVHTVLWREGLILAVVGIWFFWLIRERYKYNIAKD